MVLNMILFSSIMVKDLSSKIFLFFIIFYGIQIPLTFIFNTPLPDHIVITAVVIFGYFISRKYSLPPIFAFFMCFGLFFHSIGFYKFIPYNEYYIGDLYGSALFYYNYDFFVHFMAYLCAGIALSSFLLPRLAVRRFFACFIIVMALVGTGVMIEITEYTGFRYLGYGMGFMMYGEGDFTEDQGPWDNTILDMTCNLIGSIIGVSLFYFLYYRKKFHHKRRLKN